MPNPRAEEAAMTMSAPVLSPVGAQPHALLIRCA